MVYESIHNQIRDAKVMNDKEARDFYFGLLKDALRELGRLS
jgi:hypothetical protein